MVTHDLQKNVKCRRKGKNTFLIQIFQVTISGHSAGSASTHLHMVSPRSQGLFSKVISLSGTAANYWASRTKNHSQVAQHMGNIFNCDDLGNSQKLIDCLRKIDPVELTRAQWKTHLFFHKTPAKLPLSTFVPRHENSS